LVNIIGFGSGVVVSEGAGIFDVTGVIYGIAATAFTLPASGWVGLGLAAGSVGDTLCGGCATDSATYHANQYVMSRNGHRTNTGTVMYRVNAINDSVNHIMDLKRFQKSWEGAKGPGAASQWNNLEQQIYQEKARIRDL